MAIGTIGKYERLDVLGHGTSGVVYLAWDTLLRRQVALKEIRADGPEMERILDEARVLDRLGRHPHIVHIHSVDRENGAVLIDMELVKGANLSDVLREKQGKPLPLAEAVRITTAVLDALQYAHERRIIHRDVKPANILIGVGDVVKLTDFGLAEALGSGSVAGGGGTYPYMAPEDFAEDAASDYQADLWAMGVVLYEMLTGRRPFQVAARTKDPFAWKRVIQEDEPPPVTTLQPDLPAALNEVLRRALAKDKRQRHADAKAFSSALKAAMIGYSAPVASRASTLNLTVPLEEAPLVETPAVPFVFSSGAAVAYTLDELLPLAARYWNESRQALMDGRLERFLRAIGEVFIADLAEELRISGHGDADRRLREFLDRSQQEESEPEAEDGTVPASAIGPSGWIPKPMSTLQLELLRQKALLNRSPSEPVVPGPPGPAPNGVEAPRGNDRREEHRLRVEARRDEQEQRRQDNARRREEAIRAREQPVPPLPSPSQLAPASVQRWWFWPMLLVCVAPIAAEVYASGNHFRSADSQFIMILRGWRAAGFLSASLFIVGLGARFPAFARVACGLVIGGGLVAMGALISRVLGAHPTSDAIFKAAIVLIFPIALLLVEAATIDRMWRVWAWLTFVTAMLITFWFAQ